jgi:hypothetical protein
MDVRKRVKRKINHHSHREPACLPLRLTPEVTCAGRASGSRQTMTGTGGGLANFSTTEHWIDLGMVCLCILCAGLAAGLTIGLVSIDRNELRLMSINGSEEQKKQAAKILPLIKDHHWLLVTLFLFNAIANEALPVFLSGLVPEYAAIMSASLSPLITSSLLIALLHFLC